MRNWVSIVLVAGVGLVFLACGGGTSDGPPKGSGGSGGTGGVVLNCDTLSNPPPDCDKTCSSDEECQESFCENGKCVAQCTDEEGCGPDATCSVSGRCVPDTGTGGGGGFGGGSGCQSVTITPTRSIPNVMFLVDQSGSMDAAFGGGENRWEAAHTVINGIVGDLESIVRFGLSTYASRDGNANPPCPRIPTQIDFALNNASTIGTDSLYPYAYPATSSHPTYGGEDTPTGDSIDALVSSIQASPPPNEGPTIIVLATDGAPDSCEYPDPRGGSPEETFSRNEAVDAAEAAYAAGIDVYVLWVGALSDTSIENHLQEVANEGVGLNRDGSEGDAQFWVGTDPDDLQNEFQEIIGASISCDVQMDQRFDDKDKACAEGDVRLNGLPLDCPSEWRVKPGVDDVIELVGTACDTFKSGDVTFSAEFPCGAIIVD